MKPAACRWVDKAGGLARWDFLERLGIARVGVRGRGEQGARVGVQWVLEQAARIRFFDQVPGVHHKDAL